MHVSPPLRTLPNRAPARWPKAPPRPASRVAKEPRSGLLRGVWHKGRVPCRPTAESWRESDSGPRRDRASRPSDRVRDARGPTPPENQIPCACPRVRRRHRPVDTAPTRSCQSPQYIRRRSGAQAFESKALRSDQDQGFRDPPGSLSHPYWTQARCASLQWLYSFQPAQQARLTETEVGGDGLEGSTGALTLLGVGDDLRTQRQRATPTSPAGPALNDRFSEV